MQANQQFDIPCNIVGISTNKIKLEAITDGQSQANGLFDHTVFQANDDSFTTVAGLVVRFSDANDNKNENNIR